MRSVVVVLPASMWAMIPMLRYRSRGYSRLDISLLHLQFRDTQRTQARPGTGEGHTRAARRRSSIVAPSWSFARRSTVGMLTRRRGSDIVAPPSNGLLTGQMVTWSVRAHGLR